MKIGIVYYSGQGSTATVAQAITEGAKEISTEVRLMECGAPDTEYLNKADGIIFGCPTYMGSTPAEFKQFMDNTATTWMNGMWNNKIAAGFTNSAALSGDKLGTLNQLALFAFQHGMVWVGLNIMAGRAEVGGSIPLNRIGGWIGLMTQVTKNTESSLIESDLATARYFGRRVAELTKRFIAR